MVMSAKVGSEDAVAGLQKMEFGAPLPEGLRQVLEQAIVSGEMEPGSKINVDRLARQLGVSAIPVREALRALAARGWVRFKPRFGAYVRERSWSEAADLHETREFLEAELTALAAQRRNAESLELLSKLVQEGDDATTRGDTATFAKVNASFHSAVASAAGNMVLAELHDQLTLRIQFYFASAVSQRFVESAKEHQRIYSAIESGDASQAASLAREHAAATRAALETTLSENDSQ